MPYVLLVVLEDLRRSATSCPCSRRSCRAVAARHHRRGRRGRGPRPPSSSTRSAAPSTRSPSRPPASASAARRCCQDMAILTGGQVISEEIGLKLENVDLALLGPGRRVIVTKDETTIISGAGSKEDIDGRIGEIKAEIDNTDSDYDREKLQERLAKLSGGVAVLKVGAATEVELKEKKHRIEDAVSTTKAAIEEGVVAGGGVTLLRAQGPCRRCSRSSTTGDEATGARIVLRALEGPIKQIAENAGLEGGVVVEKVRSLKKPSEGLNAATGEYEDLVKAGIIDAAKVTRSALQNAASIAALFLTTEAVITDAPEKSRARASRAAASAAWTSKYRAERGLPPRWVPPRAVAEAGATRRPASATNPSSGPTLCVRGATRGRPPRCRAPSERPWHGDRHALLGSWRRRVEPTGASVPAARRRHRRGADGDPPRRGEVVANDDADAGQRLRARRRVLPDRGPARRGPRHGGPLLRDGPRSTRAFNVVTVDTGGCAPVPTPRLRHAIVELVRALRIRRDQRRLVDRRAEAARAELGRNRPAATRGRPRSASGSRPEQALFDAHRRRPRRRPAFDLARAAYWSPARTSAGTTPSTRSSAPCSSTTAAGHGLRAVGVRPSRSRWCRRRGRAGSAPSSP